MAIECPRFVSYEVSKERVSEAQDAYDELARTLNESKAQLDALYAKHVDYQSKVEFFPGLKELMAAKGYDVKSKAGLKMMELVNFINGRDRLFLADHTLQVFLNAELPGDFLHTLLVLAVKSPKIATPIQWRASSLDPQTNRHALDDRFHFLRDFPHQWLMRPGMNGDVTNIHNINDMVKRVGPIDLYTSDLGMDAAGRWHLQERDHLKANAGQMLLALETLKDEGVAVFKMFTFFEPNNRALITALAQLFSRLFICKPATSSPDNSEVYLVGLGYHRQQTLVDRVRHVLQHKQSETTQGPDEESTVALGLFDIQQELVQRQCRFIQFRVDRWRSGRTSEVKLTLDVPNCAEEWYSQLNNLF